MARPACHDAFAAPKGLQLAAMLSSSADAEINARVVAKFGIETVRGSGGRDKVQRAGKGGAQALILLKKAMARGKSAVMIADISKCSARIAGEGVILLARHFRAAHSARRLCFQPRRHFQEKLGQDPSWRCRSGSAVAVRRRAAFCRVQTPAPRTSKQARHQLTARLNGATERAYALGGSQAMSIGWARAVLTSLPLGRRGGLSGRRRLSRPAHQPRQRRPQPRSRSAMAAARFPAPKDRWSGCMPPASAKPRRLFRCWNI